MTPCRKAESVIAWVDLYCLPPGAGGDVVRWNGRIYERWSAWRERRPPADLYHSGLMVSAHAITYAVASPVRVTDDPAKVTALLEVLKHVPPLVWAETSPAQATCGTPTLSSPGHWRAQATT